MEEPFLCHIVLELQRMALLLEMIQKCVHFPFHILEKMGCIFEAYRNTHCILTKETSYTYSTGITRVSSASLILRRSCLSPYIFSILMWVAFQSLNSNHINMCAQKWMHVYMLRVHVYSWPCSFFKGKPKKEKGGKMKRKKEREKGEHKMK